MPPVMRKDFVVLLSLSLCSLSSDVIFLLTAGHFMGNNTVIDVLRREGYEVEHTPAGQAINK